MVCEVVLFHLPQVSRKFRVMQSVMGAVVEDVCVHVRKWYDQNKGRLTIRESPRDDAVSPRNREESIAQLREWIRQRREKGRRHYQS